MSNLQHGQGPGTLRKEEDLFELFKMILGFTKNNRFPYWHIDLNCGCGCNEFVDCPGSPLVFRSAVERSGKKFGHAYFCDVNQEAIDKLRVRLPVGSLCEGWTMDFFAGDNGDYLRGIADEMRADCLEKPEWMTGTVFCDPNSYTTGFPHEAIESFMRDFHRMDLILNYNISCFSRCLGGKNDPLQEWSFRDHPATLQEVLARFNKERWFVGQPSRGGKAKERFVLFWGTNHPTSGRKGFATPRNHFFLTDSPQGRYILEHLQTVDPKQLWFF